MITRQHVIIGLLVVFFFGWWQTTNEWKARGCAPGTAAGLALTQGSPEFGQYCRRTP